MVTSVFGVDGNMMNSDSSRNLNIKVTLIELSKERQVDVEWPSVCCE